MFKMAFKKFNIKCLDGTGPHNGLIVRAASRAIMVQSIQLSTLSVCVLFSFVLCVISRANAYLIGLYRAIDLLCLSAMRISAQSETSTHSFLAKLYYLTYHLQMANSTKEIKT